ncbi:hypothetical protein VKT23_018147 [Stygiomarasmius scandens]|uniref:Cytochrome P450 n=1 Tax=Marasmiellus scandens TaxID=2682957 RepID=A0ABR1IRQ1_9AGAR
MDSTEILVLISLALVIVTLMSNRRSTSGLLPPGPKGFWLLGLWKIPMKKPWLTYVEWGKIYGDLIHFTRFGKHYLILNSLDAANEILEKQARFTSSRPYTPLDEISKLVESLCE